MEQLKIISPKLIICDMDGTLFDTSEANYCAYKEAAGKLGYSIDREMFMERLEGRNYKDFLPEFGISNRDEIEEIHNSKKSLYNFFLDRITINEKLIDYLKSQRGSSKLALATTASGKNTLDVLKMTGMENFFDICITQEDVSRLKPDPECYELVMCKAGITPCDTVIFEDSKSGIEAAQRSGAHVINVKGWIEETGQ